jgi:hypothetical protein
LQLQSSCLQSTISTNLPVINMTFYQICHKFCAAALVELRSVVLHSSSACRMHSKRIQTLTSRDGGLKRWARWILCMVLLLPVNEDFCSAPCSCGLQSINPKPETILAVIILVYNNWLIYFGLLCLCLSQKKESACAENNTQTQTEMGPPPFWILELQTLDGVWLFLSLLTQQHVKSLALPPSRTLSSSRRRRWLRWRSTSTSWRITGMRW